MALPKKLVIMPNPALRELSRIVEDGDVDELEPVLARADINARNEHGMTALMRAAYHGRVQMVRALLEHGADPNVMRNDKFTALSLAAFFGHAEIVDILIEHGAKTDVATRFGTSPSVWAKARSFGDVARSLEKRNLERRKLDKPNVDKRSEETVPPVSERPTPVPRRVEPEPAPIVVRTLKAPPEIWDLVHEAPRNFNARAAFVARLGSQKALLTLGIVVVVAIGTVAVAMFYAKNRVSATATIPAPVVVQSPATTDVSHGTPVPETPPVATETLTAATEP
ncbi:MAG TPA: ankyrin repeat domain-containing protein, partial [Pyrinomonadaceae bacterium]|nr:ankyrin repeat domain-containing protein [Pyrinomonadaceae bacterium]